MEWEDRIQVQKGNVGEAEFDKIAKKLGYIIYKPEANKGHGFDRMVTDRTKYFLAEIKTKPMRDFYPDTGFNLKQFEEYKKQCRTLNLKMFLFFVDEKLGLIYGDFLHNLKKEKIIIWRGKERKYPLTEITNEYITYFYQPDMKVLAYITDEVKEKLYDKSSRNYPLQTKMNLRF